MKLLFVAAGSPATVFALVPLATAARNAGHDVVVAGTADMVPEITGAGLPGVAMTGKTMREFMFTDRAGGELGLPAEPRTRMRFGGHGFGRLAAAALGPLTDLAAVWRPDVVIGGQLSFAAALLAARLGVPYVRHAWDMGEPVEMDLGAQDELAPELAELGLAELPKPDLAIDLCPPGIADPAAAGAQPMRFVPAGRQQELEPWMYTPPAGRRICVSSGSRVAQDEEVAFLDDLVGHAAELGAEVVVAAPAAVADQLTRRRTGVHAGWLPLATVLRTCDLLVHSGGGQTSLTAVHAGVPQVIVPNMPKLVAPARRVEAAGAGRRLTDGGSASVVAACAELLDTPGPRERAKALSAEMAALPGPAEIAGTVAALSGR